MLYLLFGAVWIVLSDALVLRWARDAASLTQLQTYKGWAFVAASTALLYLLLRRELRHRFRAESRARENERFLSTLISNLPGMVYRCRHDWNWTMEFVSDACSEITGYRADELTDNRSISFGDLIDPRDRQRVWDGVQQAVTADRAFQLTYRIRRADGSQRWVWEQGRGVASSAGASALEGFIFDVTEHKRAEAELARRAGELARSNEELERFAYLASHDLQEPLRMVASYTQLLAKRYKGKLDSKADEFIGYAVDGVTHMKELINGLLDYSRLDSRAGQPKPVDTQALLERCLRSLGGLIQESKAKVNHDPLPTVWADRSQLARVFQNLIANALKFRDEAAPEIHVGCTKQNGDWVFSVRDNGIGIGPEHRDRIFQIFQRLHSRSSYPGTGLGLSLCKKIVERHGGRIWVDSEPGRGSTFYFTLPDRG